MTTREHLRKFHEQSAEHHVRMAKGHRAISKHFGKSEMVEGSEDLAAAHEELAKAHTDQAAYHVECCKTLDAAHKAMGMNGDGDSWPSGLSIIAPEVPSNIRAVPRYGAPEFRKATEGMDETLVKVIGFDEDD